LINVTHRLVRIDNGIVRWSNTNSTSSSTRTGSSMSTLRTGQAAFS